MTIRLLDPLLALLISWGGVSSYDCYVIYFWDYNSPESEECQRHVARMKDEAYVDLRKLNVSDHPDMARLFKVDSIPQAVLVLEIGDGDYDTGFRLKYPFTYAQLDALYHIPYTSTWEKGWKIWLKLTHYIPFGVPARKHRKDIPPSH